jgi:hypothetical protein
MRMIKFFLCQKPLGKLYIVGNTVTWNVMEWTGVQSVSYRRRMSKTNKYLHLIDPITDGVKRTEYDLLFVVRHIKITTHKQHI